MGSNFILTLDVDLSHNPDIATALDILGITNASDPTALGMLGFISPLSFWLKVLENAHHSRHT
jgi:hypothetical protein